MSTRSLFFLALFLTFSSSMVAQTGRMSTVAGTSRPGFGGDGGPATFALLAGPTGVALDAQGNVYIADYSNRRIRKVATGTGLITTVAGGGTAGDGGLATDAALQGPFDVKVDAAGNLYFTDTSPAASAGVTTAGRASLTAAEPRSMTYGANRVRRVDATTGLISTVAGTDSGGFAGDGGPASAALLMDPAGLWIDAAGNIYVADSSNHRVRRIDAATGFITTVAGNGTAGFSGDGTPATSASLRNPVGVATDSDGNIYIADAGNHRIRRVDALTQIISTVAGTGSTTYNGDGIPALAANLNTPQGIAINSAGNIIISDTLNNRVRVLDRSTGLIWPVAGDDGTNYDGSNAPAMLVSLRAPTGLAVNGDNLYIAQRSWHMVTTMPFSQTSTATTISAPSTVKYGDILKLTGAVVAMNGSTNLTGTIWFGEFGSYSRFGASPVVNGSASLDLPIDYPIQIGKYKFIAGYVYDANFGISQSVPVEVTIVPRVDLTGPSGTVAVGEPATFTITVAPVYPSSWVVIEDNYGKVYADTTTQYGSAAATLTFEYPADVVLHATLIDPNTRTKTYSAPITILVRNRVSITASAAPNPAPAGQLVTITSHFVPWWASGTVSITEGPTTVATVPIIDYAATFSTASLTPGTHTLTLNYSGDWQLMSASTTVTVVVLNPTAVALASTPNPSLSGQPVTLAASVSPVTATGGVEFYDGGTLLGTAVLMGGTATLQVGNLTAGSHQLSASYLGDSTYGPSSAANAHVVRLATSVVVSSTPNPSNVGQPVLFTASVTPATATGTVQFFDGTTLVGSVVVTAGAATLQVGNLTAGSHQLSASYLGDSTYGPGSAANAHVVRFATSLIASATPSPSTRGEAATLIASVTPATANGTVQFYDGTALIGSVPVSAGTATLQVSNLTQGSHQLSAVYSGDSVYAGSATTPFTHVVRLPSSLRLSSNRNPANRNVTVTFEAKISPSAATGTVRFYDGTTLIGTSAISRSEALLSTNGLSSGNHTIQAIYDGDANYGPSTASLTQVIK